MNIKFYKKHYFFHKVDHSKTPLSDFVAKCSKYTGGTQNCATKTKPEVDAAMFYLANHAFSIIPNRREPEEPLTHNEIEVCNTYLDVANQVFPRLFYYMLLITSRECRHMKASDSVSGKVIGLYGAVVWEYVKGLTNNDENHIFTYLTTHHTSITAAKYLHAISIVFHKGNWGSSFGGKLWGIICDTIYNVVIGQTSPEIMADTAFTLAHNTAPIFNKGMMYQSQNSTFLKQILDVQRAGMVPQFLDGPNELVKGSHSLGLLLNKLHTHMPELFDGVVDWEKVKAMSPDGGKSLKKLMAEADPTASGFGSHKVFITDKQFVEVLPDE